MEEARPMPLHPGWAYHQSVPVAPLPSKSASCAITPVSGPVAFPFSTSLLTALLNHHHDTIKSSIPTAWVLKIVASIVWLLSILCSSLLVSSPWAILALLLPLQWQLDVHGIPLHPQPLTLSQPHSWAMEPSLTSLLTLPVHSHSSEASADLSETLSHT